ncbi:MAG TPA: transglutaminaseTgpA domain-containing protein [Microcella sp.]|nr:transglutaminaseTgpA domain-containing protein [Microcella sp.]
MSAPRGVRRPALPRAPVLTSILFFSLASWAVIAVAWWPVYRDGAFVTMAAVAVPVGCTLAITASALRWPAWGLMIAVTAAIAVLGVPLAVPDRTVYGVLPEPDGLTELAAAIAFGWRRLVTIDLPVGDYQSLLVPAFVTLLVGSSATVAVALRARRRAIAVAIPAVTYPLVLALGPDNVRWPISTTLGLLLVLLLWLAVWRRHERADALAGSADRGRGGAVRQFVAAATIVLVAGGLGAGVIAVLPPPEDRIVVRTVVEQPFNPLDAPSPLGAYRASFAPAVADETAIMVDGLMPGDRVRVAVLDSYNGVVFAVGSDSVDSASGRFARVPARRDVEGAQTRRSADVTLARDFGPWLPTIGELIDVRVSGDDGATIRDRIAHNDVTDSAVVVGGTEAGLDYALEFVADADGATALAELTPGSQPVPAIVAVPEALTDWLADTTAGLEAPGEQLAAVVDRLAADGYLSHGVGDDEPPSRPGHSLERLDALLAEPALVGDAEQFAALAALAARELGFPSRIVLGFVDGQRDDGGVLPVDSGTFRERDLTAWVEVGTARTGWVPIDVVPPRRDVPPPESNETTPVTRPQPAVQPPLEDVPPPDEQAPPDIELDEQPPSGIDPLLLLVLQIVAGMLIIGALVTAPILVIVVRKAVRRRRRRRARDPATRILAGWMQATDDAVDQGIDLPLTGTRRERALASGRAPMLVLARVADRAVYAPDEPSADDAGRVWSAVDGARDAFRAGATRRERLRAAVSTRSLRRYPDRTRRRRRRKAQT